MQRCKSPWTNLSLSYGAQKGKLFNEEEDRFLICMTHQLGYGRWEALREEVRKCWLFRFDWFIKTRSPLELQRRVDVLIRLIEKEAAESAEADAEAARRRKKEGVGAQGKKVRAPPGPSARRSACARQARPLTLASSLPRSVRRAPSRPPRSPRARRLPPPSASRTQAASAGAARRPSAGSSIGLLRNSVMMYAAAVRVHTSTEAAS